MSAGPTKGAVEVDTTEWSASPIAAMAVRAVVVVVPLAVAWFAVAGLSGVFLRPAGWSGLLLWVIQAAGTGLAVSMVSERFTRRLLPLATLFNMSLVFPDQAPSRFSVALRSGTLRRLQGGTGSTSEAAEQAVELIGMLSRHDRLTRGHTERVRAYAELIAEELKLSAADRSKLAWGTLLHDVGKMTVPADILNKNGRPSETEWAILKGHPSAARELLEPLEDWLGDWIRAADEHHERWDGTGYPAGLAGTEISLAGRITAVADAYDVITSRRSYKKPMSPAAARQELIRCSGTQFDPAIVRAFLNVSLGRRWLTGPLASIAELPRIVNLGPNLPAVSAVVTGTIATVGSIAVPLAAPVGPPEMAFTEPVAVEVSTTTTIAEPIVSSTTEPRASAVYFTEPFELTSKPVESTTTAPAETTTTIAATTTIAPATTTSAPATTTTTTTALGNDPPNAAADSATVSENNPVKIFVLANDDPGDSTLNVASLRIVRDPLHSDDFDVRDDHIRYKAENDYVGTDTLDYEICNVNGLCAVATVTITVVD